MKTILVPTDFSQNADKALDCAIELAKKENWKIVLLHSLHVNYPNGNNYLRDDLVAVNTKRESSRNLKLLAHKIERAGEIGYECISKENFAVDAILETIEEKKIDLVIMGTKGARGIKEVIIGSNASKIIEKASCPVIAIPEYATGVNIKQITYVTDYHRSDLGFVNELVEMVRPFKGQINFLHISTMENETQLELMEMLVDEVNKKNHYPGISYKIITGGNIVKELEEYIERESPDLLAMSTHYRDKFNKLFNRTVTKRLVHRIKIPLLVFHYKKEEILVF